MSESKVIISTHLPKAELESPYTQRPSLPQASCALQSEPIFTVGTQWPKLQYEPNGQSPDRLHLLYKGKPTHLFSLLQL